MTPIEKNIHVVDDAGNEYEATYPKRAKGLVKNGRARFVDEHTICLARPPEINLEDKTMTNTIVTNDTNKNPATTPAVNPTATPTADMAAESRKYTLDYALGQLEALQQKAEAFAANFLKKTEAIQAVSPGDIGTESQCEMLKTLAQEQETTFRKLIDVYAGIVEQLRPVPKMNNVTKADFLNFIAKCLATGNPNAEDMPYDKIWHSLNQSV